MATNEQPAEPIGDDAPPPTPASGAHLSYAGASRVLTVGNAATVEMYGNILRPQVRFDAGAELRHGFGVGDGGLFELIEPLPGADIELRFDVGKSLAGPIAKMNFAQSRHGDGAAFARGSEAGFPV